MDICGNDSKYNGRIPGDAMYPYVELEIDRCDCQARCESDARCNVFSIDYFNDICFLSRCNKSIETWPVSQHFASKIDPTSNVSCVQVTTPDTLQQPTTMAPSTKNTSKPTDITPISKHINYRNNADYKERHNMCMCLQIRKPITGNVNRKEKKRINFKQIRTFFKHKETHVCPGYSKIIESCRYCGGHYSCSLRVVIFLH